MGAATDLYDLAADIKDTAAQLLATTTNGTPDLAYVTHGPPALDCCDQLAIHVGGIGEAGAAVKAIIPSVGERISRTNLTTLQITVTRCWPTLESTLTPPTAAKQEEAAAALAEDAWALWSGLYRARDDLFAQCEQVFFDGLVPIEPQGGCAGWLMAIRVEFGGYDPFGGS